ncbi:MAG: nickel pincer cofactor-dependent isomerase, group 22 [Planctomycetota bacterium]
MINGHKLIQIKQTFSSPTVGNISERIKNEIDNLKLDKVIKSGDSIAITAGSRGISDINLITKHVIDELIKLRGKPFIIPAMGSHGGAAAKGQIDVLAGYGITENRMGVPIKATMEVVKIGECKNGTPVYIDKNALDADHVVVINRIKSHTRFAGQIESGLIKMLLVGLGKDLGAKEYHRAIMKHTFDQVVESALPIVLSKLSVLFGLAIVENAYGDIADIRAIMSKDFIREEPKLKKEAFKLMAKLPFRNVDLLIIDNIGKDISGTGMDTNIIGRKDQSSSKIPGADAGISRIFVRDLTPNSHGNACGIGLADFTTRRLVNKINFPKTYINCITALRPEGAKIPMTFECDKDALDAAISTCGLENADDIRIVWIKSTLDLEKIIVSEGYLEDLHGCDDIKRISSANKIPFDSSGNLPLFDMWS